METVTGLPHTFQAEGAIYLHDWRHLLGKEAASCTIKIWNWPVLDSSCYVTLGKLLILSEPVSYLEKERY